MTVIKVTYKEIFFSLFKTIPPMVIVALLYKQLRSNLIQDQYVTLIGNVAFFLLLLLIARWGVGHLLKRLREEEENSGHRSK
jgi:hypothetical protein